MLKTLASNHCLTKEQRKTLGTLKMALMWLMLCAPLGLISKRALVITEVEPVFADAVSDATETDERGVPYKSLGPSSLIPVLVKAIQEQQAMIETLQAQVAELQGAN